MRFFYLICFLLPSFWFIGLEGLTFTSDFARYQGKNLILDENVIVEHELGKLQASHLEWQAPSDEMGSLHELCLKRQVLITLRKGGTLSCDNASIDFDQKRGCFNSDGKGFVTYSEGINGGDFKIQSDKMTATLSEDNSENGNFIPFFEEIVLADQVNMNFQNEFNLSADKGIYKKECHDNETTSLMTLTREDPEDSCYLCNCGGDYLFANPIEIDTKNKLLIFFHPSGSFVLNKGGQKEQRLDFSAEKLNWDAVKHHLTLEKHVVLNQPGFFTIKTDRTIELTQDCINGRKQIKAIKSLGETVFIYTDQDQQLDHHLFCDGVVTVDHEHLKVELIGSSLGLKKENQVKFQDAQGQIFANKVYVDYTLAVGKPKPTKIILEGHVRIFNKFNTLPEEPQTCLQYALADRVEYTVDTKDVELHAFPEKRVLFLDKINLFQVSAPSLTIKRDKITDKTTVQGKGDVRFSFVEQEKELINASFG